VKRWLPILLLVIIAGFAVAQTPVLSHQGAPGAYGPWPVKLEAIPDGGYSVISTFPVQCATDGHKNTSVGVAAANTPSTQQSSRKYLELCNSLQNAGNPLVKCRDDGTAPVMAAGNAGTVLGVGDCVIFSVPTATVVQCIADAAATNVTSRECS
jgi:hypothetical protein